MSTPVTTRATAQVTAFPGTRSGTAATPIVAVHDVTKRFVKTLDLAEKAANLLGAGVREQVVRAVDQVDLSIAEGAVVGLVRESGGGTSPRSEARRVGKRGVSPCRTWGVT